LLTFIQESIIQKGPHCGSKLRFGLLFFKLDEEKPALLLHLPKLFAETTVFGSASGLGGWLVVGFAQGSSVFGYT
jgi:hypothetical protein